MDNRNVYSQKFCISTVLKRRRNSRLKLLAGALRYPILESLFVVLPIVTCNMNLSVSFKALTELNSVNVLS